MTFDAFVAKWTGVAADFDGAYGAQCVDLFEYYNRDVVGQTFVGTPTTGGAVDLWNDFASLPGYTKMPYKPGMVVPKAAVVVWAANSKVTGPAGHVGMADGNGNDVWFDSFDENYPTGYQPHIQRHTYAGVLGWYVPNNQGDNNVATDALTNSEAHQIYNNITLGDEPGQDILDAWTGKPVGEYLRWLAADPSIQARIAYFKALERLAPAEAVELKPGIYQVK